MWVDWGRRLADSNGVDRPRAFFSPQLAVGFTSIQVSRLQGNLKFLSGLVVFESSVYSIEDLTSLGDSFPGHERDSQPDGEFAIASTIRVDPCRTS